MRAHAGTASGVFPLAFKESPSILSRARAARFGDVHVGSNVPREIGRFNGDMLMKAGIIVPRVRGDYQALLYEVKKIS